MTQVQVLAKELAKRPLTGKQIEALGIMNYKGRIWDLRDAINELHADIQREMKTVKSRWGKKKQSRIAVYSVDKKYLPEYKRFVKEFCK